MIRLGQRLSPEEMAATEAKGNKRPRSRLQDERTKPVESEKGGEVAFQLPQVTEEISRIRRDKKKRNTTVT
jgi:hypothetical protein